MKTNIEKDLAVLERDIRKLLIALKPDIADDYRCNDDPDDTTPGMLITIGFTPSDEDRDARWDYQTGDNSFTGGAYGHRHWGVICLHRRSNCSALARAAVDEIADSVFS